MKYSKFRHMVIFLAVIATPVAAIDTNQLVLVKIKAFRLNNNGLVSESEILSTWLAPKTRVVLGPGVCDIVYGIYLDDEKVRKKHIGLLKQRIEEGKQLIDVDLAKELKDKPSARAMLMSGQEKDINKLANIDKYKYIVECDDISPNSEMDNYFNFDKK